MVGVGAMGMAFVDTLLTESDATVAMVDRHHQPGGHWTVASPYVRPHQPSSFYGGGATELGSGRIDEVGWNKGLCELASAGEPPGPDTSTAPPTAWPNSRQQMFTTATGSRCKRCSRASRCSAPP